MAIPQPDIEDSRSPEHLHPKLKELWSPIQYKFEQATNKKLILTCTYRSPQKQAELYRQGRTMPGRIITHKDGIIKLSRHNKYPAEAMDVAVLHGGKVLWEKEEYYAIGPVCLELGLDWGGWWVTLPDFPHIELPKKLLGENV